MMNKLLVLIAALTLLSGCVVNHSSSTTVNQEVSRHYYHDYEREVGYAQAVQVGKTLYVSGVTGRGDDMQAQLTNIYDRISSILADFEASPDNIVKEVLYTTDMEAVKQLIPIRKRYFSEGVYPAATWVQIERLFLPELKLEVDVTVQLK